MDPGTRRPFEQLYEDTRGRIADVLTAGEADVDKTVPATPEWSAKDVAAHLVGVCADILDGNIEGAATEPWTAAQVEQRRRTPLREVLAEWEQVGPKVAAMLDDFPGRYAHQVIADITSHEHDVRHALGQPGARDTANLDVCADFFVTTMLDSALCSLGLGPLEVRTPERTWVVGGEEPTNAAEDGWRAVLGTAPADPKTGPPVGTLTTDRFELVRAISGRRSADQIRRLDWTVDPDEYLPAFDRDPFSIRPDDLVE